MSVTVITYRASAGLCLRICEECRRAAKYHGTWYRDAHGHEYSDVVRGRHDDVVCDVCGSSVLGDTEPADRETRVRLALGIDL